ncbi:MAG: hypothetical protein AAF561_01165 [Planctomycetota bacterium]
MQTLRDARELLGKIKENEADEQEIEFAKKVLAPGAAAIAAVAVGYGLARACCGDNVRKADPKGILPVAMAGVTSIIALWSYVNPQPFVLEDRRRRRRDRH